MQQPTPDLTGHRSRLRTLIRTLVPLLAGAALCFALVLFEELVTADMRWAVWLGGAGLFALAAWLARRGRGGWAVLLMSLPLLGLWGLIAVPDLPALWPILPIWAACAFAGYLVARRPGAASLAAVALAGVLLMGSGGWYLPSMLADRLTEHTDEPAPPFSLQRLDGEPYPVETLAGKVVVLDFFSTWCAPCRAELPEIVEVRQGLADRDDVLFLVVGDGGNGDSREEIAAFAEQAGLGLPFAYDPEGEAHDAFGFSGVPALAVLDRQGRVRLKHVGYNAAETGFREHLTSFLAGL